MADMGLESRPGWVPSSRTRPGDSGYPLNLLALVCQKEKRLPPQLLPPSSSLGPASFTSQGFHGTP